MISSRIPDEGGSQGKGLVTNKDKPPHKTDKSTLPTTGDDSASGITLVALAVSSVAALALARKVREH